MVFKISNYFLNALEFYLQILECNVIKDNTFMVNTVASLPHRHYVTFIYQTNNRKERMEKSIIKADSSFWVLEQ